MNPLQRELIDAMLEVDPDDRPTAEEVNSLFLLILLSPSCLDSFSTRSLPFAPKVVLGNCVENSDGPLISTNGINNFYINNKNIIYNINYAQP